MADNQYKRLAHQGGNPRQVDSDSFGNLSSLNANGYCNIRSNQGRYHKVRLNVSGTWKYIQGVELEAKTTGKR